MRATGVFATKLLMQSLRVTMYRSRPRSSSLIALIVLHLPNKKKSHNVKRGNSMMRDVTEYKHDVATATGIVILVCFVLNFMTPYTADTSSVEKAIARNLVEQANHWYHTCLQDKNAQMRMQHISYANAYVHAARHVMNDADLERATGTDVHGLQSVIEHTQQTSLKDLHKHCPRLKPSATSSTPSSKRSWA